MSVNPVLMQALLETARKSLPYFQHDSLAERTRNWFMFGDPHWKFLVKPNGQPDKGPFVEWQRIPPEE